MSYRVRPASGEDFRAIYQMAKLTGGGFTNLPPERGTLIAKLDRSDRVNLSTRVLRSAGRLVKPPPVSLAIL